MEHRPYAPLKSWDIFIAYYHRLLEAGKDIQALKKLSRQHGWKHGFEFRKRLLAERETIFVTDLDQHIVFASQNMTEMNGYTPDEVIGKRPTIFQGPHSDPDVRKKIRKAVEAFEPFQAVLVNYRKNGTPYHCWIDAYPILDRNKQPTHFIAFEKTDYGLS